MASDTIISWNFPNWVTVVLMAAIMFALLGIAQKYMQSKVSGGAS